MVYVDEIRIPTGKYVPKCFVPGYCHLTADTLDELHEFAKRIGLKQEWFQNHRVPHYDLTAYRLGMALAAGAKFIPAREQAWMRRSFSWLEFKENYPCDDAYCKWCGNYLGAFGIDFIEREIEYHNNDCAAITHLRKYIMRRNSRQV